MKRVATVVFLLFLTALPLRGGSYDFGLGIILGEPTGITFKYWASDKAAFDGALAWSFSKEDKFHIHGDYLFHSLNAYTLDEIPFNLYYGIGARVKFTSETQFGIRFPLGTTYTPTSTPLEVFCEIVPLMDLAPDTAFRFNTGLGIRYYF
ncbi:MAG TPA: hypothetical protein PLV02_03510 [Candidatus Mcinerneyibacteriales bacterium]|jgi:hypothetical protein|nr:hypothetical protein [Candidatus Mcinerneyibacteriales bacterium]